MKALFIIGHPKSGTSLVNSLLDSHEQLVVFSEESDFYLSVWPKAEKLNWQWRKRREEKINELFDHIVSITHFQNYLRGKVEEDISGNLDYETFPKKEFERNLKAAISNSLIDKNFQRSLLFKEILSAYVKSLSIPVEGKKYWVEKTPKHTWHIGEIMEDFPDVSFVFVCRDPRDNYYSFNKKLNGELDPVEFSKSWTEAIRIFKSINNSRTYIIRYEDVILRREKELRELLKNLGLDWKDSLLEPTKLGADWKGNSMFGIRKSGIHNKSIGRYKKELSDNQKLIIEYLCQDEMKEFGYELQSDFTSIDEKLERELKERFEKIVPFRKFAKKSLRKRIGIIKRKIKGS